MDELINVFEFLVKTNQTSVKFYFLLLKSLKPEILKLNENQAARILYFLEIKEYAFLHKKNKNALLLNNNAEKSEKDLFGIISQIFTIFSEKTENFNPEIFSIILKNISGLK